MARRPLARLGVLAAPFVLASTMFTGIAGAVGPAVTVAAVSSMPLVISQSGPLGDITLTEAAPGQLHVGDVITFQFSDSASAAKLHFSAAGTVGATNGLAGTVSLANSSGTLADEMKITVTATSAASAFPGVLTLSGLNAATDPSAATGNDHVAVSDTQGTFTPLVVSDANLIVSSTLRAPYVAVATPTIIPTLGSQIVGNVAITEPAKSFFSAGDVITFTVRDANGSANTVGLAATPYAAGGSMTVSVSGTNTPSVQTNDTSFNVTIVAGDPSQGSASTITVSNLTVNSAEAPLGPVTLSAVVTSGPDVGTALIAPGRVSVANVGGNTTTVANGTPTVLTSTTGQMAGNIAISATAGSVSRDDVISVHIQSAGVTFTATTVPIATVTSGSVVFANAAGTLDNTNTTASWKVTSGATISSTIAIGPIYFDVSSGATVGQPVSVLVSAQTGSAFTSQIVTDAVVASSGTGVFTTVAASVPVASSAPFGGAPVIYKEPSAGSIAVGNYVAVVSPYATQIAAYRATFAALPSIAGTGGIVFGAGHVNSSAIVVATPQGTITAPAQTVAYFPVTTASTSASTITISNLTWSLGNLVAPGALTATGLVSTSVSLTTALTGNQFVDTVNTRNIGTSAATTPPVVTLTQEPPVLTNVNTATFAFGADQYGAVFSCALDAVIISLNCPSPLTLPSLSAGAHIFSVQAVNLAGYSGAVVNYSWTIDNVAPTATVTNPVALSDPFRIAFSKAVNNISAATVVITSGTSLTPTPVTGTLSCVDNTSALVPCVNSSYYSSAVFQPTTALTPGQTYNVTLNPIGVTPAITDLAGNVLALTTTSGRVGLSVEENSTAVTTKWASVHNASASGGGYATADVSGATATFTFTGTSVTWLTETGPSQGKYSVTIDGISKGTATTNSNYATTPHYKVARAFGGLSVGTHVIVIKALGVKAVSTATGAYVSVDAFIANATTTEDTNALVVYGWSSVAATAASGSHYVVDDAPGATLSLGFVGTSVTWNTVTGPQMGLATVTIDGVNKGTFNSYASALHYKVAHGFSGLTAGAHVITITVQGKHLAPSTGSKVAVDSFIIG